MYVICVLPLALVLALRTRGVVSYNLDLLAVGFLGLLAGCQPISKPDVVVRKIGWLGMAYIVYLALVSMWGVPYLMLLVSAFLNVLVIYSIGIRWTCGGAIQQHLVLLGRYSLLAYIAQIAALQLLRKVLSGADSDLARWTLSLGCTVVLTSGTVIVVDLLKARSGPADEVYRFVFS